MKILLLEDDEKLGGANATALVRWGHQVEQVLDGREALAALTHGGAELLFTPALHL